MIVITGWRSHIAEEFRALLPTNEIPVWGKTDAETFPLSAERYLFCHGLLRPKSAKEQTWDEVREGMLVNFTAIKRACDRIIAENDGARICIIGSESGYRGSFDGIYAAAKRHLHRYIESVELRTPSQQIVGISPWIIADTGMTERRADQEALRVRGAAHPKQRFLMAREVAELARYLLYEGSDFLSGVMIRMHGGLK